jgi:hypothetical protein
MVKGYGLKLATPMTPQLRVGRTSSALPAVASVTFCSNYVTGRCIGTPLSDP